MKTVRATLALAVAAVACSASDRDLKPGDAAVGGAASGGTSGVGGVSGGAAGASTTDAGDAECPLLMFRSGNFCIDKQPALHADGSQGSAVSWTEAVTICEARGARLCTETERETACPDGQVSLNTQANGVYCGGPASTWEWSSAPCSNPGHCLSPCCNAGPASGYGCHYDACDTSTLAASYHCCKTLP